MAATLNRRRVPAPSVAVLARAMERSMGILAARIYPPEEYAETIDRIRAGETWAPTTNVQATAQKLWGPA